MSARWTLALVVCCGTLAMLSRREVAAIASQDTETRKGEADTPPSVFRALVGKWEVRERFEGTGGEMDEAATAEETYELVGNNILLSVHRTKLVQWVSVFVYDIAKPLQVNRFKFGPKGSEPKRVTGVIKPDEMEFEESAALHERWRVTGNIARVEVGNLRNEPAQVLWQRSMRRR